MPGKTEKQFNKQIDIARSIFINKNTDYGTSWRIMRIPTFIDQIYIKAQRIRSIEEAHEQKVPDSITSEYIGIINYCILTLIQLDLKDELSLEIPFDKVLDHYDHHVNTIRNLMLNKNHDYGEAWKNMYPSSYTDIILTKILRIRTILENKGTTLVSEGIESNLFDIVNYSFFGLIKLSEHE